MDFTRLIYHEVIVVCEARTAEEVPAELQISDLVHFTLHIADFAIESLLVCQFLCRLDQMIVFTVLIEIKGPQFRHVSARDGM